MRPATRGVLIAAAVLASAAFARILLARDEAPPDDRALWPVVPSVADTDNAYGDFLEIERSLRLSHEESAFVDRILERGIDDWPAVEKMLAANAKALARLEGLSRKSCLQPPAFRDPKSVGYLTPIPQMVPLIRTAKLSSLHSALLLKQGKPRAALDEALRLVESGHALAGSRTNLIVHLVGILLKDVGLRRLRDILERTSPPPGDLRRLAARLKDLRRTEAGLQDALRFEYVSMANMIDRLAKARIPEWEQYEPAGRFGRLTRVLFYFQPNRTKGLFAARFRTVVAEAGKPCLRASVPAEEPRVSPLTFVFTRNGVGRFLYDTALPRYEKLYARRCADEFQVAAVMVMAAMKAYRLETGGDPAGLDRLVPAYVAEIPTDPFNASPLKYSPEKGVVYTDGRGPDGKDLSVRVKF